MSDDNLRESLYETSVEGKINSFSILENQIENLLTNFEFEKASLLIDQFLDLHSDSEGTPNNFIQEDVKALLHRLYKKKKETLSLANQAENKDANLIAFLDEIEKFQQKLSSGMTSIDRAIGFADIKKADLSKPDDFLSRLFNISKKSKIICQPYICSDLFIDSIVTAFNNEYFVIIPLITEDLPIYDAVQTEYINILTCSALNRSSETSIKTSLIGYEFLKSFDAKNKKRFFRSVIRNFLISKYENSNLHLENISFLLESENDVSLFNSVLKNMIDLLKYNFIPNVDLDLDSFLLNHPYSIEEKISVGAFWPRYGPIESLMPNDQISFLEIIQDETIKRPLTEKVKKSKIVTKLYSGFYKKLYTESEKIITEDPQFRKELEKIFVVKEFREHILLLGESGVGKTEIAEKIHSNTDRIKNKENFVAINCASIPETLIESELFGYAKGAHSTAGKGYEGLIKAAEGGTLFLDEIGKAPLNVQAKLLKFIDEKVYRSVGSNILKKVDTRIIFATNDDPLSLIKRDKMLPDFYYRISKYKFTIPPLRDRKIDLKNFILFFKKKCEADFNISLELKGEALKYMLNLRWPGNIRQIDNTMSQIFLECKSDNLSEITTSLVEKHIENIPDKTNLGIFTNFNESFRLFFEYWKSIKSEFDVIKIEKAKDKTNEGSLSGGKNKSNNSHSFLKLIIEPMAAHIYDSTNLSVNKVSEILGISLAQGQKYSPYHDRLNKYQKIKRVFEKLEN